MSEGNVKSQITLPDGDIQMEGVKEVMVKQGNRDIANGTGKKLLELRSDVIVTIKCKKAAINITDASIDLHYEKNIQEGEQIINGNIKHPSHYAEGREFEPKDVIRDWELNFNLGNAIKYIARAGRKDDIIEDLRKAQEYIQFEIDAILNIQEVSNDINERGND